MKSSRLFLFVIPIVLSMLLSSTAFAAPTQWESVEVTMHYDQQTPVVLISGTLPDSVQLPAQVELAVPAGGQFQWAGEILGGDPSADPTVQYTTKTANGMDLYAFTLTKARTGQVEVILPSAVTSDGTKVSPSLNWTAISDVPRASLFVRVPAGSQILQAAEEATMSAGPTGYSYYSRTATEVKAGTTLSLAFAYTAPTQPAQPQATSASSSDNPLPLVFLAAVALGAFVLIFMGIRGKMSAAESIGESDAANEPQQPRTNAVHADVRDDAPGEDLAEGLADDELEGGTGASAHKGKAQVIIAAVVVVAVIGGFIAADRGTSAQEFEGTFVRDFGNTTACTNTQVPLELPDGDTPEVAAEKVFTAVQVVPSLGKVTVDVANSVADVGFCDSSATAEQVSAAIAAAGLLAQ